MAADDEFDFPFCHEVSKYEQLSKIGQGTFGEVFKARDKKTRKLVALKKVLMDSEREGFPITALREIRILQLLKDQNIVNLIEICRSANSPRGRANFYLVFDFCEHDLAGLLINTNVIFSLESIKAIMKQLLHGLFFIHGNKILHRDMKAANILINKNGCLKIADFGLARAFSVPNETDKKDKVKLPRYTNRVVTLWYRPPELLLGERAYTTAVDIWGVGCIMAEMWTRSPIMQGSSEINQLHLITGLCGEITPEVWPGCERLALYEKLKNECVNGKSRTLKHRLSREVKNEDALDLIDKMLALDPKVRCSASHALEQEFFWNEPLLIAQDAKTQRDDPLKPCRDQLAKMLAKYSQSMFEFTAQRNRHPRHAPYPQGNFPQRGAPSQYRHGYHPHRTTNQRPNQNNNNDGQYRDHIF